jgi:hypothetical protein
MDRKPAYAFHKGNALLIGYNEVKRRVIFATKASNPYRRCPAADLNF